MKTSIFFVISTIFLGIVSLFLFYSVYSLQTENNKLRQVVRGQAQQISEIDSFVNNVCARGMNADNPIYRSLDTTTFYK